MKPSLFEMALSFGGVLNGHRIDFYCTGRRSFLCGKYFNETLTKISIIIFK